RLPKRLRARRLSEPEPRRDRLQVPRPFVAPPPRLVFGRAHQEAPGGDPAHPLLDAPDLEARPEAEAIPAHCGIRPLRAGDPAEGRDGAVGAEDERGRARQIEPFAERARRGPAGSFLVEGHLAVTGLDLGERAARGGVDARHGVYGSEAQTAVDLPDLEAARPGFAPRGENLGAYAGGEGRGAFALPGCAPGSREERAPALVAPGRIGKALPDRAMHVVPDRRVDDRRRTAPECLGDPLPERFRGLDLFGEERSFRHEPSRREPQDFVEPDLGRLARPPSAHRRDDPALELGTLCDELFLEPPPKLGRRARRRRETARDLRVVPGIGLGPRVRFLRGQQAPDGTQEPGIEPSGERHQREKTLGSREALFVLKRAAGLRSATGTLPAERIPAVAEPSLEAAGRRRHEGRRQGTGPAHLLAKGSPETVPRRVGQKPEITEHQDRQTRVDRRLGVALAGVAPGPLVAFEKPDLMDRGATETAPELTQQAVLVLPEGNQVDASVD